MAPIDLLDDLLDVPSTAQDPTELERYAQEARASGSDRSTSAPLGDRAHRRTSGACGICHRPAERRCLRCETAVCPRHHHVMFGLCTRCTAQDTDPLDEHEAGASDGDPFADTRRRTHAGLDVDWIE